MNVLIIAIDSKIVNLALAKVEIFHKVRGDSVVWNMPLFRDWADRIYVSCIFKENAHECSEWEDEDKAVIGGSGYDITRKLPKSIESIKPHIDLGFTTRGCIRKCPFCIVPEKEGKFRVVGDLFDLWGGGKEVTLLDNNILADIEHFKLICRQAREKKLKLDFNQGLDHRLLTQEVVDELKRIRHKEYRFSFDRPGQLHSVEKALNLLQGNGLRRSFWYVLVGFDTTFQQDLYRLNYLRDRGQTAFVQRYRKTMGNRLLGQWANRHAVFRKMEFKEFLEIPKYRRFREKYVDEVEPYLQNCSA